MATAPTLGRGFVDEVDEVDKGPGVDEVDSPRQNPDLPFPVHHVHFPCLCPLRPPRPQILYLLSTRSTSPSAYDPGHPQPPSLTRMHIVDLSHPITPDMPVYPGTEPPTIATGCTIEQQGFEEKKITLPRPGRTAPRCARWPGRPDGDSSESQAPCPSFVLVHLVHHVHIVHSPDPDLLQAAPSVRWTARFHHLVCTP